MTTPFRFTQDEFKFSDQEDPVDPRSETAMGRASLTPEEKQALVMRYKNALSDPITSETQRRRIGQILSDLGDRPESTHPYATFGRGIAKGALQGALGLAELPLKGIELVQRAMPGEFEPTGIVRQGRRLLQEGRQAIEEDMPSSGPLDVAGRLAGGIVATGPMWASIARSTGQAALKILPAGSKLAQAITAAESGTIGQRIVGQELINIPVDALDAIDQLDTTTQQKLISLGIAVGGTALGASLPASRSIPASSPSTAKPPGEVDLTQPTAHAGTPTASTMVELQASVRAANARIQLEKATKEARREFKKLYPEKKWKDLTVEQQAEWINASRAGAPLPSAEAVPTVKPMSSDEAAESLANIAEETGQLGDTYLPTLGKGTPGLSITPPKTEGEGHTVVWRDQAGDPKGYYIVEQFEGGGGRGHTAYVDPSMRQQGIGKSMLQHAESELGVTAHDGMGIATPEGKALVESVNQPKTVDLTGMGSGIASSLYDSIFKAHQKGSMKMGALDEPVLVTATKLGKVFASPEEISAWVKTDEYKSNTAMAMLEHRAPDAAKIASSIAPAQQGTPVPTKLGQLADEAEALVASNEQKIAQNQSLVNTAAEGKLRTLPVQKLLGAHSIEELTVLKQQLKSSMDNTAMDELRQSDLLDIALAERKIAQDARAFGVDPGNAAFKPKPVAGEERAASPKFVPEPAPLTYKSIPVAQRSKWLKQDLTSMDDATLGMHVQELQDIVEGAVSPHDIVQYAKRLEQASQTHGKRLGIEPSPMSELRTGEGRAGAGFDKSLIKKLGENLYASNREFVIVRELVQNAVDAVRGAFGNKPGGEIEYSSKALNSAYDNGAEIRLTDNGSGMSPDVAVNHLLDIGSSFKDAESAAGGFGIAKVALFHDAKEIEVLTRAKVNGQLVETKITGSGDDWMNGDLEIVSHPVSRYDKAGDPQETGTSIRLVYDNLARYDLDLAWAKLERGSSLDGVKLVADNMSTTRTFPAAREFSETIDLPGSRIDVSLGRDLATYGMTEVYILNNGIEQFQARIHHQSTNLPDRVFFNVQPKGKPEDTGYPFNTSRDALKGDAQAAYDKMVASLSQLGAQRERDIIGQAMKNAPSTTSGRFGVVDFQLLNDKRIAHDLATMPELDLLGHAMENVIRTIHQALNWKEPFEFAGFSLNKKHFAMNLDVKTVAKFLGEPHKTDFAIFVNPLTTLETVGNNAQRLARHTFGSLVHELAHNQARGHNEQFSSVLTDLITNIADYVHLIPELESAWNKMLNTGDLDNVFQRYRTAKPTNEKLFARWSGHRTTDVGGNPVGRNAAGESVTVRNQDGPEQRTPVRFTNGSAVREAEDAIASRTAAAKASAELDKALVEKARRENPPRTGGVMLQSPPEILSTIGGYLAGLSTGDDPEERQRNALIGASIGLGGSLGWRFKNYKVETAKPRPKFAGEEAVNNVVVTRQELSEGEKKFKPFASKREEQIEGTMRPGFLWQKAVSLAGGRRLGWALNMGKQTVEGADALNAAIHYMVGTPTIQKLSGEYIELHDVANLQKVLAEVDGDVKGLGNVSFALHAIEKAERYGKIEPKLSPEQALRYVSNVPQRYIDAARKFRQLSSVLVEQGVELEMITREVADKMLAEQDYTPILRIYDEALMKSAEQVDLPASKASSTGAPQPFKSRQGSKREYQVLNPVEAFSKNLVKYNWAFAEQRRKLTLLAQRDAERALLKAEGKDPDQGALSLLIRRKPGVKAETTERYRAHVERIKATLNMREAQAEQVFDSFNPKPVADSDPSFSVWRNGEKVTYSINPQLADTFRMPSQEAEAFWFTALEMITKGARFGVTRDPTFSMRMTVIDNWQAWLSSNYGFRFGLDHLAGFLTLLDADKAASKLSGVADIGTARRGYMLKRPAHLLSDVFKADDPDALVKLAMERELSGMKSISKATKEMKWGQAYNLILSNIAEAGRMGLYLAATRKGASIDDAIYEATMAIGNYQTRGKKLEKLSRVALFLNPAVKGLDAELTAMGVGPGSRSFKEQADGTLKARGWDRAKALNYFGKGMMGISFPTIALYFLNKDDEEIERLRKTDAGRRFNFIRVGDQIYRLRKSFVSGQIFGTGMEEALDQLRANDPAGLDQWLQTMIQDLPMNVLPTGLGIAGALMFDQDPMTGIPIAGSSLSNRLPSERERLTTSEPARRLGQALDPLSKSTAVPEFLRTAMSPVGIDFLTRALGGTLAGEALQGLTVAHEWSQQNYLRPAAEMPLIRSVMGNSGTTQALAVERFYDLVERVDQTMTTMNHLKSDPVRLAKFVESHRPYIALAPTIREVRSEIQQMRQSLEDVRTAPANTISPQAKLKYRQAVNRLIVQRIEFLTNSMKPVIARLETQSK